MCSIYTDFYEQSIKDLVVRGGIYFYILINGLRSKSSVIIVMIFLLKSSIYHCKGIPFVAIIFMLSCYRVLNVGMILYKWEIN